MRQPQRYRGLRDKSLMAEMRLQFSDNVCGESLPLSRSRSAISGYPFCGDTPEVVEADRVTWEDCFLAKVVVCDVHELETVIYRFLPFSSTDTAIIQSTTVVRRLPKL